MAPTYNLLADFSDATDIISTSPYWVVGVARFANPATFDPALQKLDGGIVSFSDSDSDALQERPHLVLTSDVLRVQNIAAKQAHVTNLSISLASGVNYLSEIMPGDWICCCMLNDESSGLEVADRMRQRLPVNSWQHGMKFLGRVGSVRKRLVMSAEGKPNLSFVVNATGFGEFDSRVFYHPQLQKLEGLLSLFHEFGITITDITNRSDNSVIGGLVDINKVIPKLVRTILGTGAWARAVGLPAPYDVPAAPNTRYLVPQTVGAWFGRPDAQTYATLLNIVVGLHHYGNAEGATEKSARPGALFCPDGLHVEDDVLHTGSRLNGTFGLSPPPTDASVWEILTSYLAAPINELYVALRVDIDGNVLPHLICRQTPYSSSTALDSLNIAMMGTFDVPQPPDMVQSVDVTDFMELPRWQLPTALVRSFDIGRADALRFNMVHVSGTSPGGPTSDVDSFIRAPPNVDILDIKRNGLRPYMPSVNCTMRDLQRGPQAWRAIMTDIAMGQHLMLNGSFTCVGIQAPICPGDNLEFDGVVFHIESVVHVASINDEGKRSFETTLSVSHGLEAESRRARQARGGPNAKRRNRYSGTNVDEQDLLLSQGNVTST